MIDPDTLSIASQLLVIATVMAGPTLLFLGLWRLLNWLRDDRLLAELEQNDRLAEPLEPPFADLFGSTTTESGDPQCVCCGNTTPPGTTLCHRCEEFR